MKRRAQNYRHVRRGLALAAAALAALAAAGPVHAGTGDLVVADSDAFGGDGGLIEVDATAATRTRISENASPTGDPDFRNPIGLMAEPGGGMMVSGFWHIFSYSVYGVDVVQYPTGERDRGTFSLTGGGYTSPSSGPAFAAPWGAAVDANGDFLVVDQGLKAIVSVDGSDGDRAIVSDNNSPGVQRFVNPFDVDVLANGDIVVTDAGPLCASVSQTLKQCGVVFRVDPTSGERSVLASNKTIPQVPQSHRLHDPRGLTVDPVNGDILVANEGGKAIIRVDENTGAKTLVSDNTFGGTTSFEGPRDLVTDGDDIYVTDGPTGGAASSMQVMRIHRNGLKYLVSRNGTPAGAPDFDSPWGIDFVPVTVSGARSSPGAFAPETIGQRTGMLAGAPRRGTTFRYRLGERARTSFTLWRRHAGRTQGYRCRRPTSRNRRGRRCVRWLRVGSFTHRGRRGENAVRFSGRLRRGGALSPGRYRAIVVARNPRGVRSTPVAVPFRVRPG